MKGPAGTNTISAPAPPQLPSEDRSGGRAGAENAVQTATDKTAMQIAKFKIAALQTQNRKL
jgi:hypothetical protein